MTRKYRLERTAFIGCRNTAYMDVDDANWLVCPPDLAQTLYETRQLPKDAAVFCPDARGRLQKNSTSGSARGAAGLHPSPSSCSEW